jgi:alpha-D-xyloside xylohydrolase
MKTATRRIGILLSALTGLFLAGPILAEPVEILPGVWRFTLGAPEQITPVATRHYAPAADALAALPGAASCPVTVRGAVSDRGYLVSMPLAPDELIYGLGLQLQSLQQRGTKKRLRVEADPAMDTGDSHAPVPFYVTTRGYGVLVDTARYATFYLGNKHRRPAAPPAKAGAADGNDGWNSLHSPYERLGLGEASEVLVEVPEARGVDVYVFAGPTLLQAVQRYNLFSGGGPLPPRWGLGFWYRVQSDYSQEEVLKLAAEFRERRIPCDVLGLEPHWQSHSYSCSFVWSRRFSDPRAMIAQLGQEHFHLNLWEHAFTHPSAPIYAALLPHAGDYEVWGGLVPDFLEPEARRIFADFHEREHVALGVSGYKLDECDNSDFTGNWSFPEISRFPSGADGEQMHSLFGLRYQDTIQGIFEKRRQRTYGLVRSSGALAAPYPYVLYSDLYQHREFIHGVAQSGFSGLLWTPEVRDARSPEDLLRRLETVVFSPLAMVNAWYMKNPPWKQVERAANDAGRFAPGWEELEAQCRTLLELRMRFVPYLHAAFVRYHREGLPPFRALVMDYPDDPEVRTLDDEYLMGDSLLVAPVASVARGAAPAPAGAGRTERSVYLPAGEWYDYWTGRRYDGRQRITLSVPLEQIPLFVKAGTVLPLAQPTLSTDDPASWRLTALVFGDGARGATLFEDDGGWEPALNEVRLEWNGAGRAGRVVRTGQEAGPHYEVVEWKQIP